MDTEYGRLGVCLNGCAFGLGGCVEGRAWCVEGESTDGAVVEWNVWVASWVER